MFARSAAAAPFSAAVRAPAAAPRANVGARALPAGLQVLRDRPLACVAGAAGALAVLLAAAVLGLGDPHAGAPRLRQALGEAHPLSEQALRGAATPLPGEAAADPLAAQAGAGEEAVITLPDGGHLAGALSTSAVALGADAPSRPLGPPLAPAPFPGLTAPGPGGLLPIIGKDGRTPFAAYARPFTANGKPRIALVVGGLGLNAAATRAAIARLPPEVTLSFVPYADGLQGWIDQARAAGHEAVLEAPMEPVDYPNNDPGPMTLMAKAAPVETVRRMEQLLSRATRLLRADQLPGRPLPGHRRGDDHLHGRAQGARPGLRGRRAGGAAGRGRRAARLGRHGDRPGPLGRGDRQAADRSGGGGAVAGWGGGRGLRLSRHRGRGGALVGGAGVARLPTRARVGP